MRSSLQVDDNTMIDQLSRKSSKYSNSSGGTCNRWFGPSGGELGRVFGCGSAIHRPNLCSWRTMEHRTAGSIVV